MKQSRSGRRYDAQFKEQAVQLLLESDQTLNQVAKDLGVSSPSLQAWKRSFLREGGSVRRHGKKITAAELEVENQRLRQENEYLRTQRDILKKSLGILSEPPLQKGMPK